MRITERVIADLPVSAVAVAMRVALNTADAALAPGTFLSGGH